MKLLLDTHVLLWSLLEPGRLTRRVAAELQDQTNELWLSPLSTWEVLVLAEKGRIVLEPDPAHWIAGSWISPIRTRWTGSWPLPPGSTV